MKQITKENPNFEEENFLDESGYTMNIPEQEWPTSDGEWNQLYTKERELITTIRQSFGMPIMDMELDEIVELIRSKNLEEVVIEWAYIHRKIRSIMRKQKQTIMIVPTSQLLLRASDLLKN